MFNDFRLGFEVFVIVFWVIAALLVFVVCLMGLKWSELDKLWGLEPELVGLVLVIVSVGSGVDEGRYSGLFGAVWL